MRAMNKITLLLLSVLFVSLSSQAQETDEKIVTAKQLEQLVEYNKDKSEWFASLETPGVRVEGTQMLFSDEARKLIGDETYRASCYREAGYTFTDVQQSLAANEIQKAFWQMINLYPENKETVLRYIYAYDNLIPTDKVVAASFYTYGFFDPSITKIEGGKPNIYRPDLFELQLKHSREIIGYIMYFRQQKAEGKS